MFSSNEQKMQSPTKKPVIYTLKKETQIYTQREIAGHNLTNTVENVVISPQVPLGKLTKIEEKTNSTFVGKPITKTQEQKKMQIEAHKTKVDAIMEKNQKSLKEGNIEIFVEKFTNYLFSFFSYLPSP